MVAQKELKIPIEDLVNLVLKCECGSEVCIDFRKKDTEKDTDTNYFKTKYEKEGNLQCPVCRWHTFDAKRISSTARRAT